ncbi:hypothetical protein HMPREF9443_01817 [Phascolarctobacterium succinatutens YIT 12067]|uniref:Uncharacterized protein n=1 Tax=Phascolarctobacterium succinatutens YIT 12067 TaxID=626939 RepID=E8LG19_9FIRM|nr:hypothetical protein HMPREF9443_01817 [Phascolarctobacterium succinatutens YIT 12067]
MYKTFQKHQFTYIAMYVVGKNQYFSASQCMKFLQNQSML